MSRAKRSSVPFIRDITPSKKGEISIIRIIQMLRKTKKSLPPAMGVISFNLCCLIKAKQVVSRMIPRSMNSDSAGFSDPATKDTLQFPHGGPVHLNRTPVSRRRYAAVDCAERSENSDSVNRNTNLGAICPGLFSNSGIAPVPFHPISGFFCLRWRK